jgi:hypothetical protein
MQHTSSFAASLSAFSRAFLASFSFLLSGMLPSRLLCTIRSVATLNIREMIGLEMNRACGRLKPDAENRRCR